MKFFKYKNDLNLKHSRRETFLYKEILESVEETKSKLIDEGKDKLDEYEQKLFEKAKDLANKLKGKDLTKDQKEKILLGYSLE